MKPIWLPTRRRRRAIAERVEALAALVQGCHPDAAHSRALKKIIDDKFRELAEHASICVVRQALPEALATGQGRAAASGSWTQCARASGRDAGAPGAGCCEQHQAWVETANTRMQLEHGRWRSCCCSASPASRWSRSSSRRSGSSRPTRELQSAHAKLVQEIAGARAASRRRCARRRRWRRSASSPAASRTTSTTCWR